MIYRKTNNVTGWQGWIDAVAAHPNVTRTFNKRYDYMLYDYPYRYDRVEFLVAGKYVALERVFRGDRYTTHTPDMPLYLDDVAVFGNFGNKTFDPAVMADPDQILVNADPAVQQCLDGLSYYGQDPGYRVDLAASTNDVGLVDDNFILHAVHVFADADNLYIILEPEEGTFFHLYYTGDITKHTSFGSTLLGGGGSASPSSNTGTRSYRSTGWQYQESVNAPWLLNSDLAWSRRDNTTAYDYGYQLRYSWAQGDDRMIVGGAPPGTVSNGEFFRSDDEQFLSPGSDQVQFGANSIYGRSLAAPIRWWYKEGPTPAAYPLFSLNQVKTIHMRGIRALQEFIIDGVTWVAFPDLKLPNSYGGSASSIFAAWADESFATPMGVLIRKD